MSTNLYFYHPRWPVLYNDNHLLALFKPAGLLAQGDHSGAPSLLDLAKHWVKERYKKPGRAYLGLVHRLDRPVAGVMLFARTSKAASRLSTQFRIGSPQKVYLAVVEGVPERHAASLSHHIVRRGRSCRIVPSATRHSQEAHLRFQLIDSTPRRSLLQVELLTGRKHQIRLQLSHAGYPLVGDVRYGASTPLACRQIALLAKELTIEHPTRKIPLRIVCPLPTDWPWPEHQESMLQPYWNWDHFRVENEILKHFETICSPSTFNGSTGGT